MYRGLKVTNYFRFRRFGTFESVATSKVIVRLVQTQRFGISGWESRHFTVRKLNPMKAGLESCVEGRLQESTKVKHVCFMILSCRRHFTGLGWRSGSCVWLASNLDDIIPSSNPYWLIALPSDCLQSTVASPKAVHVYHMNNRRKTIITRYYHEMDGHAWPIRVLANVRRKFWITKRAAQIKSESTGCYKCRLLCPRPCEQIMIPLSASRMYAGGYPFQVLGLVY